MTNAFAAHIWANEANVGNNYFSLYWTRLEIHAFSKFAISKSRQNSKNQHLIKVK